MMRLHPQAHPMRAPLLAQAFPYSVLTKPFRFDSLETELTSMVIDAKAESGNDDPPQAITHGLGLLAVPPPFTLTVMVCLLLPTVMLMLSVPPL